MLRSLVGSEMCIRDSYKASTSVVKDIVETTTKLDECIDQASIPPRKEEPAQSIHDMFKEEGEDLIFDLDDAVKILRDLSQGTSRGTNPASNADIASLVKREIRSFMGRNIQGGGGGQMTNPNDTPNRFRNGGNLVPRRGKKRTINGLFENNKECCLDCGSDDHERGSDKCKNPSWMTKRLRTMKNNNNNNNTNNKNNGRGGKFFRPRYGAGQLKQA